MVAGLNLPSSGRGLHKSDDVAAVGAEPPFLPTGVPVLHLRDHLLAAGHRIGRQLTHHRA